jgi:hypothetical protein
MGKSVFFWIIASASALVALFVLMSKSSSLAVRETSSFSFVASKAKEKLSKEGAAQFKPGYQRMYDMYFDGHVQARSVRLLEIGLGCGMVYGPGWSADVWATLFPVGEIWIAEWDAKCAAQHYSPSTHRWKYVTGDQGVQQDLERWVKETGGRFDYIIDDGGHASQLIYTSFCSLFENGLKPGGTYFIEDLHVASHKNWNQKGLIQSPDGNSKIKSFDMRQVLGQWVQQLTLGSDFREMKDFRPDEPFQFPILPSITRIDCQDRLCAITKKS